jgi:hypothetical protein
VRGTRSNDRTGASNIVASAATGEQHRGERHYKDVVAGPGTEQDCAVKRWRLVRERSRVSRMRRTPVHGSTGRTAARHDAEASRRASGPPVPGRAEARTAHPMENPELVYLHVQD